MTVGSQDYARLADHAYNRDDKLAQLVNQDITLGGIEYTVLGYADKPSGYQGAIYQRKDSGEIVVAHRGTESDRERIKDLALTDGGMGFSPVNSQTSDAISKR